MLGPVGVSNWKDAHRPASADAAGGQRHRLRRSVERPCRGGGDQHQNRQRAVPYHGQIGAGHGKDIAEKTGRQVNPYPAQGRHGDKADGQCGIRETPQKCVNAVPTFGQCGNRKRHGQAYSQNAREDRDRETDAQRQAQQCRMGRRIAEISYAPPGDEAAKRGRRDGHAHARQSCADQEIIRHHSATSWAWS